MKRTIFALVPLVLFVGCSGNLQQRLDDMQRVVDVAREKLDKAESVAGVAEKTAAFLREQIEALRAAGVTDGEKVDKLQERLGMAEEYAQKTRSFAADMAGVLERVSQALEKAKQEAEKDGGGKGGGAAPIIELAGILLAGAIRRFAEAKGS